MSLPAGKSITELPNELTSDIDLCEPHEILRLFRQVDAQLFSGYREFVSLSDYEFQANLGVVADLLRRMIHDTASKTETEGKKRKRVIVFSGCGTSGRLAFFCSQAYQQSLGKEDETGISFRYLIAGGDKALVRSQENAEDDPIQGAKDLQKCIEDILPNLEQASPSSPSSADVYTPSLLFIGITCGMSAPYIAGQLDFLRNKVGAACVLLGFTPIDRARNVTIEKWQPEREDTFKTVACRLKEDGWPHCILAPVVGPEAVTGSTRMKGGTATKIILDTIFLAARSDRKDIHTAVRSHLLSFRQSIVDLYDNLRPEWSDAVRICGNCLRESGHVYYLGCGRAGILGFVDASECVPTFGADVNDIRGYIDGGWSSMKNLEGDISSNGDEYVVDMDHFRKSILPNINSNSDVIVDVSSPGSFSSMLASNIAEHEGVSVIRAWELIGIPEGIDPAEWNPQKEIMLKLMLNSLSTGAHILRGMVYRNRMINVRVSNHKLFHRAIDIVRHIMPSRDHDDNFFADCILRALYRIDTVTDEHRKLDVSTHIQVAYSREFVVPIALLLASGRFTVASAEAALERETVVRRLLQQIHSGEL
eukprot:TRINITY_DN674_c0_g1_i2.p1 TRINITY_DN674_c0_g1~~TRINITY_DN674_c0_g1_i2.p1  ORF type:complete len:592 (-),score=144.31 TRINITY_DN674_c0_g1_i2:1522-3297(-)